MTTVVSILCGGRGSRLWPISRPELPKPFADPFGTGRSLLVDTILRSANLADAILVIGKLSHADRLLGEIAAAKEIEPRLPSVRLVLETAPAGTSAAMALAAHSASEIAPDATLAVLPADHWIRDTKGFERALSEAIALASAHQRLVHVGVEPSRAETDYGWIEAATAISPTAARIASFHEKPKQEKADGLFGKGALWNAGIYVAPSDWLSGRLEAAGGWAGRAAQALGQTAAIPDVRVANAVAFEGMPNLSFDHAVAEREIGSLVVRGEFDWSDVGSFAGLKRAVAPEPSDNAVFGEASVAGSAGCVVKGSSGRLIVAVGLRDTAVIDDGDVVLVTPLDQTAEAVALADKIAGEGDTRALRPSAESRPWGSFRGIARGPGYLVKEIRVLPRRSLSLQRHKHRAETWTVASGVAEVQRDQNTFRLIAGETVQIPLGAVHRLFNPSYDEELTIVEVQRGKILLESDIERLEDTWGRSAKVEA